MTTEVKFKHVGEAIKARRDALGLTQEELCDRLGWPRKRISDVSQIETGTRANLTVKRLSTIAKALDTSISDLVHGLCIESAAPTHEGESA